MKNKDSTELTGILKKKTFWQRLKTEKYLQIIF